MSHQCPAQECERNLPDHLLMCKPHWYMVSPPLRSDVWDAYQGGAGGGTIDLMRAQSAAIEDVDRKIAAKAARS